MGNCQAAEAATVVVQHPGGRVERLYWATSAAEVMRANPGHYVAVVTLRVAEEKQPRARPRARERGGRDDDGERRGAVRVTRVKLLKPRDTLMLGHAYRLITVDEVTKALQAKKEEKSRRAQQLLESKHAGAGAGAGEMINSAGDDQAQQDESLDQVAQNDRDRQRSSNSATHSRHRQWRPSLHSIAEVSS
ncbi:hypothetical protein GUJ93_ZPchr0006g43682 [Zizania palustris]|uniref:Uncharacterized protein n=1 Tax=Zizania palustris TaxID=103762 RepID=A0A8J5T270_ZIZPA|nr:hypothetical protein GUJ93_ZPchr0006g43682 [Zizania palustris]